MNAIYPYIKQVYGDILINTTVGMSYDEFIQTSLTNNNQCLIVFNGFTEIDRYETYGVFADKYSIFIRLPRAEDSKHKEFRNLIDGATIQDDEGYKLINVTSGDYIRPDKSIIIFEVRLECYPLS